MLPEAGSIARNGAIAGIYAPFPRLAAALTAPLYREQEKQDG